MDKSRFFKRAIALGALLLTLAPGAQPLAKPNQTPPPSTREQKLARNLAKRLEKTGAEERLPVILRFTSGTGMTDRLGKRVGRFHLKRELPSVKGVAAELTPAQIKAAAASPDLLRVDIDEPVHALLDSANQWFGTAGARVDFDVDGDRDGAPEQYSNSDVAVAVIDSGIDATHVDLQDGKVIGWNDLVQGRPDPYDDLGHGTHVASIIAGTGAGDGRYQGVAPGAALVGVKVLDGTGSGFMSDVIAGIEWVVAHQSEYGVRVINMSLGSAGCSDGTDPVAAAVDEAVAAGVIVVAAAGNDGPYTCSVGSPGSAAQAITVGAAVDVTTEADLAADPQVWGFAPAFFSSRGPTADGRTKPDILAPGWQIMAASANSHDQYIPHSGTSMATPFVAGTVALMLDANPNLTPTQVKQILKGTAEDWGDFGPDNDFGAGRLDGYAAVRAAAGTGGGQGPTLPSHAVFAGRLDATGAERSHFIEVTDTALPLAATLSIAMRGGAVPDFDLSLIGPDGSVIGSSTGESRQEEVSLLPPLPGRYEVRVVSKAGAGPYSVDLSYGGATFDQDRPPSVTNETPLARMVVGTLPLSASAMDDIGVAQILYRVGADAAFAPMTDCAGLGTAQATCQVAWDSAAGPEGDQRIEFVAVDTAGQESVSTAGGWVTIDNDPSPILTVESPAGGAQVSGLVHLSASATDNQAVTSLGYSLDFHTIIEMTACTDPLGDTSAACSAEWDSRTVPDGPTFILLVAQDSQGQYQSVMLDVMVENDSDPVVTIESPAEGSTVGDHLTLQVSASDDQSVAYVSYALDGGTTWLVGDCTGLATPMATCRQEMDLTDGPHELLVTAVDSAGQATRLTRQFTARANQPPSLQVLTPGAGATVSGLVQVQVEATDDQSVTELLVSVDSATGPWAPLTTCPDALGDGSALCTFEWNSVAVPNGSHTLWLQARDGLGGLAVTTLPLTVKNDTTAPEIFAD